MAKKLWGGRFDKKPDPMLEEFTSSIMVDNRMAYEDVLASILHCNILKDAKLISPIEHKKLSSGLKSILKLIENGKFKPDLKAEDIHTQVQELLEKKIGKTALKIHMGRSRNDQVATDLKMYCKKAIKIVNDNIVNLEESIQGLIFKNKTVVVSGYTHLQHAQPIKLSVYFGAYLQMLTRDKGRLSGILKDVNLLPLGSAALAGNIIPKSIYKSNCAKFGFGVTVNSVDSVSDRDFVIEILSAFSILAMHLSRLAEDFIIWNSSEFDFIKIDDAFCTGSSIMPQKKNPDVLELIRGYAGKLNGNLVSVLTMMKGLPLSYNRDMQLDKEPLFSSIDIINNELEILSKLVKTIKINKTKIKKQLEDETLYATDLADYLVKEKKIPQQEAHRLVGKLVNKSNGKMTSLNDKELKSISPSLNKKILSKVLNFNYSIRTKHSR